MADYDASRPCLYSFPSFVFTIPHQELDQRIDEHFRLRPRFKQLPPTALMIQLRTIRRECSILLPKAPSLLENCTRLQADIAAFWQGKLTKELSNVLEHGRHVLLGDRRYSLHIEVGHDCFHMAHDQVEKRVRGILRRHEELVLGGVRNIPLYYRSPLQTFPHQVPPSRKERR